MCSVFVKRFTQPTSGDQHDAAEHFTSLMASSSLKAVDEFMYVASQELWLLVWSEMASSLEARVEKWALG